MRKSVLLLVLPCFLFGCYATPLVIDNGTQSRVFTPCTNNNLCFRDTYNVTWDNGHSCYGRDYPVSYRSKQSEYESNRVEYILLPQNSVTNQIVFGGER
jgi:hypothetical protein